MIYKCTLTVCEGYKIDQIFKSKKLYKQTDYYKYMWLYDLYIFNEQINTEIWYLVFWFVILIFFNELIEQSYNHC